MPKLDIMVGYSSEYSRRRILELSPSDRSLAEAKILWGSFPFKCFLFTTRDLLNVALSFGVKWIGGRWKNLACCLSSLVRY